MSDVLTDAGRGFLAEHDTANRALGGLGEARDVNHAANKLQIGWANKTFATAQRLLAKYATNPTDANLTDAKTAVDRILHEAKLLKGVMAGKSTKGG